MNRWHIGLTAAWLTVGMVLSCQSADRAADNTSAWGKARNDPAAAALARPSEAQYAWHEHERIMFVHFGVATWEGTEYDADGKTDLTKIDPAQFDAGRLCDVAQSWGARQIVLVAKHVGGFCWWPTETTDYCTRAIPWRSGRGNMVKEVAEACRRHGLSIGIYLYPDDTRFTKGIGRSGKTDDPARQEEWNRLFRRQWREVLQICGADLVREVWLDGGCRIELGDILKRYAPNAVVFQGRNASIRWVGNESGIAPESNWNTLKPADLKKGSATAAQSTPDGEAWAPVECDVPLYDHNWFWNKDNERKRRSVGQLLEIYLQSAGRGSVMLLNSTPDTDGLIPEGDRQRYREFGRAIERNFGRPFGRTARVTGSEVVIELNKARAVNCVDLWEEYRYGHRVRKYEIDARTGGRWRSVAGGRAVGRRKLDLFSEVTADAIRVRVTGEVGTPMWRQIMVHRVDNALVDALGQMPTMSRGAALSASSTHSSPYAAANLIDGSRSSRWSAKDEDRLAWVEYDLHRPRRIARICASELAGRVRGFVIEVRDSGKKPWRTVFTGGRIGAHYNADFPPVTARFARFRVTKLDGIAPTLWELNLYDRPGAWEPVADISLKKSDARELKIDLSAQVVEPRQYDIRIEGAEPSGIVPLFEGKPGGSEFLQKIGADTWRINRTQAIGKGASTAIRVTVGSGDAATLKVSIRPS